MTGLSNVEKVDVVGVGLNATDTLIPVAHYPARGTKVAIRPTTVLPGGQTATAVVACQQWGLRTRYVGKVGGDSAAALHAAEFSRREVLRRSGRHTAPLHTTPTHASPLLLE